MTNQGFLMVCDQHAVVKNIVYCSQGEPDFRIGAGIIATVEPHCIEKSLNFLTRLREASIVFEWELNFLTSAGIVKRCVCGIVVGQDFILAGAENLAECIEVLHRYGNEHHKLPEETAWILLKQIAGKEQKNAYYEDFTRINNELATLQRQLARKNMELQKTVEREQSTRMQLEQVAEQRETLFREVQHRVKNNLQVISSLLRLQENKVTGQSNQQIMREAARRVHAMGLIHDQLYSIESEVEHVHCGPYISRLVNDLLKAYSIRDKHIGLTVNCGDITMDNRRIVSLGLILNELISNSLKYAFPDSEHGEIRIDMNTTAEGKIEFEYHDNGIGLPKHIRPETSTGLGMKLMTLLSEQMDGQFDIDRSRPGTTIRIVLTDALHAESQHDRAYTPATSS